MSLFYNGIGIKTNSMVEKQLNQNKGIWISAHVFTTIDFQTFLLKGIKPIIALMYVDNLVSEHFFIRYWESGPHIRLRLKTDSSEKSVLIKTKLNAHFDNYFKSYPSVRPYDKEFIYPNNSVQFIKYQPETERYGGERAILIAEKLFMLSSDTVIKLIENNLENWDDDLALGLAIEMHLRFILKILKDSEERIKFIKGFLEWSILLTPAYNQIRVNEGLEGVEKMYMKHFEKQYNSIAPFVNNIKCEIKNGSVLPASDFENWDQYAITIAETLHNTVAKFAPQASNDGKYQNIKDRFWSILYSCMHMTNNRLGIKNIDEGYLAFILLKTI